MQHIGSNQFNYTTYLYSSQWISWDKIKMVTETQLFLAKQAWDFSLFIADKARSIIYQNPPGSQARRKAVHEYDLAVTHALENAITYRLMYAQMNRETIEQPGTKESSR